VTAGGPPVSEARRLAAVIVDDESGARRGLKLALARVGGVEVRGEFRDPLTALQRIPELDPDVVFLDLRMPGLSGMELLERLSQRDGPDFVIVTAHDDQALRAFELAAVDYVLKPYSDERLGAAVERVVERWTSREARASLRQLRDVLGNGAGRTTPRSGAQSARFVTVPEGDRVRLVPVAEVHWLEADRNHVVIHTTARTYRIRASLAGVLEGLGKGRFARVHRSHAVQIDAVREIQPWFSGDYLAILRDGTELRVSRRYKDAILKQFL
jgi:two-component system LytT family response regulator